MPILCQIDRYIQISWLPFVHLETSCVEKSLTLSWGMVLAADSTPESKSSYSGQFYPNLLTNIINLP